MKNEKSRLTADQCLAFALECEGDAQTELDPENRRRLLRIAEVMRSLAEELRKARLSLAEESGG